MKQASRFLAKPDLEDPAFQAAALALIGPMRTTASHTRTGPQGVTWDCAGSGGLQGSERRESLVDLAAMGHHLLRLTRHHSWRAVDVGWRAYSIMLSRTV